MYLMYSYKDITYVDEIGTTFKLAPTSKCIMKYLVCEIRMKKGFVVREQRLKKLYEMTMNA